MALNAAGLKNAATDPDLKQSIDDLKRYVTTSGAYFLKAQHAGVDPVNAMVIAGVAGELSQFKPDYDALLKSYRDRSATEAMDLAAGKLGEHLGAKISERVSGKEIESVTSVAEGMAKDAIKKSFSAKTAGPIVETAAKVGARKATPILVPTIAQDAAKVGARFIMAYEAGVLDTVAPRGFRPLLEKNATTRVWLDQVTAALQTDQAKQLSANSGLGVGGGSGSKGNSTSSITSLSPATSAAIQKEAVGPRASNPASIPSHQMASNARTTIEPSSVSPTSRPGGVSISRAAAERMPLGVSLDAAAVSDGKIILSGHAAQAGMDAALFLSVLRAACTDHDPYFSLDPDDGALWSQQGERASDEFWNRIKADFPARLERKREPAGIELQTISALRDYPVLWKELSAGYPNFRSKLVFQPLWLKETRLGEVLYKADVLLKELSSGVSILRPGELRARRIPGYLASDTESAARGLLELDSDQKSKRPEWRGSRLWFDIVAPQSSSETFEPQASLPNDASVRSLFLSRGLLRSQTEKIQNASYVVQHGNVFDLSQVTPQMFVRVHDPASNKDLSDHDPRLDGLASDVTKRFDTYADAYEELAILRDVVRSYVAAVKIVDANQSLCRALQEQPLLPAERVAVELPQYHPSELFLTVGFYWSTTKRGREGRSIRSASVNGGVSIAGQQFADTAMRVGETAITKTVMSAINGGMTIASDPDRKFISLSISDISGAQVRLASNTNDVMAGRGLDDYPIENEPKAAKQRPFERSNNMVVWIGLGILACAFVISYRSRRGSLRGR
ncbi:hypothetical protein [Bradyrhizobium sp. CCBAU 53338]|uniref:hypothetical protein n=1 Tax=Bradyrhizobium sp. CCBAU 53338 TaxID=1325111 RepID=UPI00188CD10B|nr:hypothetical protein [Bradyrhizobium sp. CCBAU 53338]